MPCHAIEKERRAVEDEEDELERWEKQRRRGYRAPHGYEAPYPFHPVGE